MVRAGRPSEARRPVRPGERTSPEERRWPIACCWRIPDDEFRVIRPHLQFVCLPQRSSLHEANTKLEDAYFLNTGMVSLVFTTRGGESVEVGVVGNEGFTPIPIAAGFRRSPHCAVMQIGGEGFKVSVDVLETVLPSSPGLRVCTGMRQCMGSKWRRRRAAIACTIWSSACAGGCY